ncbi:MAG TPA: RDD family protein [Bacilli bacterium]|nr:RDD family protein [Bacilli bacterium]HPS18798.1 RDD family protein [Bacilli bacterium]
MASNIIPSESANQSNQPFSTNAKPHFMQRFAGGLIDICIIFLFYWLCYFFCMNTPISHDFKDYQHQITEIEDMTKLDTGYGEKILITAENGSDYLGYQKYIDEEQHIYVVKIIANPTEEIRDSYIQSIKANEAYSNLTFDKDLINYGINVLCGTFTLGIFLLAVPLMNQRRATIGQLFAEEQLFATRYESRALWYQVLFRYLFILIICGCLPFLFFGLYTFFIVPVVFLVIASLTKSGRTLHDLITGTKVIDKKTFTPLVADDDFSE